MVSMFYLKARNGIKWGKRLSVVMQGNWELNTLNSKELRRSEWKIQIPILVSNDGQKRKRKQSEVDQWSNGQELNGNEQDERQGEGMRGTSVPCCLGFNCQPKVRESGPPLSFSKPNPPSGMGRLQWAMWDPSSLPLKTLMKAMRILIKHTEKNTQREKKCSSASMYSLLIYKPQLD